MLTELEKVNPGFYPVAAEAPKTTQPGFKRVGRLDDGFMTRDEFAKLYKNSSEVLHTRNPYKGVIRQSTSATRSKNGRLGFAICSGGTSSP